MKIKGSKQLVEGVHDGLDSLFLTIGNDDGSYGLYLIGDIKHLGDFRRKYEALRAAEGQR